MGDNGGVTTAPIQLTTERISATIDPHRGGRLTQLTVDGAPLLVGYDDAAEVLAGQRAGEVGADDAGEVPATGWGSFPMVPWAGRIRHGRFSFDGSEYHLPINHEDHAIHGVGFTAAWDTAAVDPRSARLHLSMPADHTWPFGGEVAQRFEVDATGITTTMTVTATDRPFPVSFGWHPWFRKPSAVGFSPTSMYRRDDDHVAVDELIPVPDGPWDDCFVNTEPVTLSVGDIAVRITSDCDHWVVYDERSYATCVEPQTGPPDAFNIAPRRLEPGESVSAWYRIAVE